MGRFGSDENARALRASIPFIGLDPDDACGRRNLARSGLFGIDLAWRGDADRRVSPLGAGRIRVDSRQSKAVVPPPRSEW